MSGDKVEVVDYLWRLSSRLVNGETLRQKTKDRIATSLDSIADVVSHVLDDANALVEAMDEGRDARDHFLRLRENLSKIKHR